MALSATLNHLSPPNPSASSRLDPLRTGAVKLILPSEASVSLRSEGYRLLDIRPVWEWEKARVVGSLHVPLFVEDTDMSPLTLLKKWVHFGYIGLWTGQLLTTVNEKFVDEVKIAVPDEKDRILVACGEGLRSKIAISILHKQGYKNLGWLAGGFNRSTDGDFSEVEGTTKLQYASIGGVSYIFLQLLIALQVLNK